MGILKKFNDFKITVKLTIAFFVIAFSSIAIIGLLSYFKGKNSLEKESFESLTAVREMKASQIEDYFDDIGNQVITFSEDHTIISAMIDFKSGFEIVAEELNYSDQELINKENNLEAFYKNEFLPDLSLNMDHEAQVINYWPEDEDSRLLQSLYISENPEDDKRYPDRSPDSSSYSLSHAVYHPIIRSYLKKFHYYDIFLIDNESGYVVYSVFKEVDYATSLIDGPYKNSNLARVFKEVRDSDDKDFIKLVDFEPYEPSGNEPAAFIASPIYDGNQKLGVLIFQLPIDRINDIMTNRHEWAEVGLGVSGETYIVSDDYTLRNQSRFFIEDRENYLKMITDIGTPESTITKIKNFESTIGLQVVQTYGTEEALAGKTNTKIFNDYRDVPVLSSYKPLNILDNNDVHWVIMSEIDRDEAFAHVYDLRKNILVVFGGLFLAILLASVFISKKITKPIKLLTLKAQELAAGNLDVEITSTSADEIGVLSSSFSDMQHSINDLVHNLEDKVAERTKELQSQKDVVEEKNKEIVDSINYALRLQNAIIPTKAKVKESLPQSFVLFKPKDIVSGDFYWMADLGDDVLISAVDCTGHGVPGAMVSVVGANGLNRCVKEFNLRKPSDVLDKLTDLVVETFESGEDKVKDGMDGAFCSVNLKKRTLEYAGANNPLWIVRKGAEEIEEIKANKQPIGSFEFRKPFVNHEISLSDGDTVYFFSDGYVDQFGGPRGKKLKYKALKQIILEIQKMGMDEQESVLEDRFETWKGNLEQLDDVCVIGIRF